LCLEKAGLTQQLLSGKRLVKVRGMKFVYVDESGDQGQSDIFVMAGLLIDAYRLRKWTAAFDEMIKAFLKMHPKAPQELKTKAFINGANKWSEVDADDRKQFLEDVCDLAAECARIFAVAFSFDDFKKAVAAGYKQPFGKESERKRLLEISRSLYARDRAPARPAPDPRALAAVYWDKRPDGDI
jgi:hypothetical protein